MPVRCHPAGSTRPQSPGGDLDEGKAKGPVFPTTVMEGGIHENEVEVRAAALRPADIAMPEQSPGIAHIATGAGDRAAINVPKLEARHPVALKGPDGQDSKPAAQVGAVAFKGRQGLQQKGGARIKPVPAEDTRLGPQAQARVQTHGASLKGSLQADGLSGTVRPADPVLPARLVGDVAAEPAEGLGDPGAAAITGPQGDDLGALGQKLDRSGQDPVSLKPAWGRQDQGRAERGPGCFAKVGSGRLQGRDLEGAWRLPEEDRRWMAVKQDRRRHPPD
jgi:hypothetical protein